ncbi:MAG: ion transporter [Lachnospiraceae bacterium]|nr:ion transporter [Lachnospiraceae bacterium]
MNKLEHIKRRIFEIIQIGQRSDIPSFSFDIFITFIIFTNLFCTFFLTFEESRPFKGIIDKIEFFTIIIFMAEYILRLWTAGYLFPKMPYRKALPRFIFSFYGLVDLLSFIPYFFPIFFPLGAVAFRIFRVFRIFRLFQINASYDAFNVISDVLKEKKDQLISSMCMILIFMLASSLCMYSFEHEAQPENFQNAFSGIWWSVSTLLTVGYGDIYPITIGGKIMAIIISFLGVGMVAIPTGIISAGFVGQYTKVKVLDTVGRENNIKYLLSVVSENHPWNKSCIGDIVFPPQLVPVVVVRDEEELLPRADLKLNFGDVVVITSQREGMLSLPDIEKDRRLRENIELKEIFIGEKHPWVDSPIKSLDISRQEFIVMIERKKKIIVPDKDSIILGGDVVIIYSKEMQDGITS